MVSKCIDCSINIVMQDMFLFNMFVCMIVCVVFLYTIVDFKSSLELVLYVCFISTLNKTLILNLNLNIVYPSAYMQSN
jgi:hypothetical protein